MIAPLDGTTGVDADVRTADGRVPGERGMATRRRLLETTARMLGEDGLRDLAVVDIAREAGVSAATFYQYFGDVEDAIVVIAEHVSHVGGERLLALVSDIAEPGDFDAGAQALAAGYLDVWREYDSVLRVIDLAAAEGDDRFAKVRTAMLTPSTLALRDLLDEDERAGDPLAIATVLTAAMTSVATHRRNIERSGMPRKRLVDAMAYVVIATLRST